MCRHTQQKVGISDFEVSGVFLSICDQPGCVVKEQEWTIFLSTALPIFWRHLHRLVNTSYDEPQCTWFHRKKPTRRPRRCEISRAGSAKRVSVGVRASL